MNYFKAAEQVLMAVPTLKTALQNLTSRKERLLGSGKPRLPGAITFDKPFTDAHAANDTLNDLLELTECVRNIDETKRVLSEIETILGQLSDEHKKIVELWYIEKRSKQEILSAMHYESFTTVYNARNRAVAEFALLFYGASAMPSV